MPLPPLPNDALLYAVSARRRLSWADFKTLYATILTARPDVISDGVKPYLAAQALDMLAHCEVAFEQGRGMLRVAPQILARLPVGGLPQAVLVGSRAPATLPALRSAAEKHGAEININDHSAHLPLVPSRVTIVSEDENALRAIALETQMEYAGVPPAWQIVDKASSLDDYLSCQPERHGELEGWRGTWFNPLSLHFTVHRPELGHAQLSMHVHPVTQQERFFWRHIDHWQEVDKDWGRYAALRESNVMALAYDPKRFVLAVPLLASLPRIFGRALCLCSGYSPRVVNRGPKMRALNDQPFKLFQWVPREMAELVAMKLGQQRLVHVDITDNHD